MVQEGCETAARGVAKSRNIPIIELLPMSGKAGTFELKANEAQNINKGVPCSNTCSVAQHARKQQPSGNFVKHNCPPYTHCVVAA